MKAKIILGVNLLFAASSLTAYGSSPEILRCTLRSGGTIHVTANPNRTVDLTYDSVAQSSGSVHNSVNLPALMTAQSSSSTRGAVEFFEVGASVTGGSRGGLMLRFQTNRMNGDVQFFGRDRSIPLSPLDGYNVVINDLNKQPVSACYAGPALSSVSSLKNFVEIVIAD